MNNDTQVPIVDAFHGRTNVVTTNVLDENMHDTFTNIIDLLIPHCGPWGRFAMVYDLTHIDQPPKFTKDGINILRATRHFSHLDRLVSDQLAYIGQSVERVAGDGTTSAILIAAKVILTLWNGRNELQRQYTYSELQEEYAEFVDDITALLDKIAVTYKDVQQMTGLNETEAIRLVTRWQALTSSHGDNEIASLATDVFTAIPPEAWPYITFERNTRESTKRVECVRKDAQYTIPVKPLSKSVLNHSAGLEYKMDDCVLIPLPNTMGMTDILSQKAITIMEECAHDGKPCAIICPAGIDAVFTQQLLRLSSPECAIFTVVNTDPFYNDIMGLLAASGRAIAKHTDEPPVLPNVSLYMTQNGDMAVNGLYVNTDDTLEHPDCQNPDSVVSQHLDILDKAIAALQNDDATTSNMHELTRLRKLYVKIKYTKQYVVRIGGTQRDNAHAIDLLDDVLRATQSSLSHGFVPACNMDLGLALYCLNKPLTSDKVTFRMFCQAFSRAVEFVHDIIMNSSSAADDVYTRIQALYEQNLVPYYEAPSFVNTWSTMLVSGKDLAIQPAKVSTTILKRFGDCFLRYLYTDKIVVPGGCVSAPKND